MKKFRAVCLAFVMMLSVAIMLCGCGDTKITDKVNFSDVDEITVVMSDESTAVLGEVDFKRSRIFCNQPKQAVQAVSLTVESLLKHAKTELLPTISVSAVLTKSVLTKTIQPCIKFPMMITRPWKRLWTITSCNA